MRTLKKDERESRESLAESMDSDGEDMSSTRSEGGNGSLEALRRMFRNPFAVLLLVVPVAWVLAKIGEGSPGGIEAGSIPAVWHFLANFFSIIPLSWLISECTEHLEKKVGPMLGALLNSTFGNVVEMILSTTAILQGKFKLVQSALLGAMLMNTLGVLGVCFLVAGCSAHKKKFNRYMATYNLALLSVASLGLSVPTGLAIFDDWSTSEGRLSLSRWVAICLFLMYVQWIVFNLCTHKDLFEMKKKEERHFFWVLGSDSEGYEGMDEEADSRQQPGDDEDEPELSVCLAGTLLLTATVIVSFHCDWLVEAIKPVSEAYNVHEAFMATVLIPMVGNFSEVIAAVSIACKGKLDLAMGVAIGSATQLALCVIPVAVFIAWFLGKSLDLDFEVFQVRLLYLSILVGVIVLIDGEANWLKGSSLLTAYVLVAISFWWMSDREFRSAGESPLLQMLNRSSLADNSTLTVSD